MTPPSGPPLDNDIRVRFLTGAHRRHGVQARTATRAGYIYPYASQPSPSPPATPRQPPKILVPNLLTTPSLKHSTNAARTMSEFVAAQQDKLRQRPKPKRRPLSATPIDARLWLDEHRYAAWTMDGHLVSIEDRHPRPPIVRLTTEDDRRQLFAINRLIDVVIALYPGDSLENASVVTRYMAHNDLEAALRAAFQRAIEGEQRLAEEQAKIESPPPNSEEPKSPRGPRKKKSRFHPLGSFVLHAPPADDDPPFAIRLPLGVSRAFEDRRKAVRYLAKKANRDRLADCQIARVLQAVTATPVFRKGIEIPRAAEQRIALIRKEPRIVEPDLHLELIPRFVQGDDREWQPQEFKLKRTVRHRLRLVLLEQLRQTSAEQAPLIEDEQIRNSIGVGLRAGVDLDEWRRTMRVAQRAERILPKQWRQAVGLPDCDIGPYWPGLNKQVHSPPPSEGHWIRAPIEFGELHPDGLRARLVELRIDDLAGVLERFGMTLTFWMIKDSTTAKPRWVLPVTTMERALLMESTDSA